MASQPAVKVLAIRTDKPEAELYLYSNFELLNSIKWQAHRQLAETLNTKIEEILDLLSISYKDLGGIVVFKGPGSFTGLRIGFAVANALAYAQNVPILATGGHSWIQDGINQIKNHQTTQIALPEYGAPAHITKPKK